MQQTKRAGARSRVNCPCFQSVIHWDRTGREQGLAPCLPLSLLLNRLSRLLHLLHTTFFLCRTLCTCCILGHICLSMLREESVTTSIGVSTLGAFLHLLMGVRSAGHLLELTSEAWIWMEPQIKGATSSIQILRSNPGNQHGTIKCW